MRGRITGRDEIEGEKRTSHTVPLRDGGELVVRDDIGTTPCLIGILSVAIGIIGLGAICGICRDLKYQKSSKLEKQVINVSPSDSTEKILHDEKTGINYLVKYAKGDTLQLVPYDKR